MIKRILKRMLPGVPEDYGDPDRNLEDVESYEKATLITSLIEGQKPRRLKANNPNEFLHAPVIDIDYPISVMPSSTPGHYHLYIEKPLPWKDFAYLLLVMAKIGLVEPGFASASISRGYTAVRLPWIKKDVVASPPQISCTGCGRIIKPDDLIQIVEGGYRHYLCKTGKPGVVGPVGGL